MSADDGDGNNYFDDAYHRIGDEAKDVDTKKKGWWKPLLNRFLLPLAVIGLIVLLILQFRILGKTD